MLLTVVVDMFYMKTCSFRGAEPRCLIEGLFCASEQPEAKYGMVACGNLFCPCCHPPLQWMKHQPWPVVQYSSSQIHNFVNKYQAILNCPAVSSVHIFGLHVSDRLSNIDLHNVKYYLCHDVSLWSLRLCRLDRQNTRRSYGL